MKYELIEDVTPKRILSAYVNAPFDEGKKFLESRDYKIPSLEEIAKLRMQEGFKSDVSQNGNCVLEDAIYVPNKGVFLTKISPIMDNAKKAVEEQRNGRGFCLEDVERYLDGAVRLDDDSIPINESGQRFIPTNRFNDFKVTRYAFGKHAEDYGKFLLNECKINEMPIRLVDMQNKSFARKIWFWGLGSGFDLDCDSRALFYNGRVRGVKMSVEF